MTLNPGAPTDDDPRVCPRCGGTHTRRQACGVPVDEVEARRAAATTPPAPVGAPVASGMIDGPSWPRAPLSNGDRGSPAAARPVVPVTPAMLRQQALFGERAAYFPVPVVAPRPRSPEYSLAALFPAPFAWPQRRRMKRSVLRRAGTWLGAIIGTIVLIACLAVAGTYIAMLTQADQDVPEALGLVACAVAVGLVGGMALLYVSARVYAKIVFAALAVLLITGGAVMLTIAPVLRQMNTEELAEYQAFSAMLWFGALALGCGIVLALACLRWATRRHALRALARWSRLLGTAYGVMLGLSGLGAALSLLIAGEGGGNTSVIEYTIWLTAMVFWGLAPGVILTYHGISSSVGEGSSTFHVPPASWMIVGWVPTLALGWWIMRRDVPLAAPMPLLDVAAVALPAVALVSMAWRGSPLRGKPVRGLSWRHVTLAAAISMTVGVQVAIYVESLGSFTGVVLMLVHNGAFANVRDSDGFFRTLGDSNVILSRNEQFFANLITASVCAPLIEEFGKGLGVRFLLRRDTTRSQAFVLGAAAGAGFAVLETLLYAVPNPGVSGPGEWGPTMLIRAGGLHILNTAVIGLAWWYAVNGHRPRRAWLLFGLAVFNHAAWNTFATVLDARILGLDTLSNRTLEIAAYSVLGAVSVCYITAIPAIARRLRRLDATAPVSGELALMSPWLGG